MKEVEVYYNGILWGKLFQANTGKIYFQYSAQAIESKIELSPLRCKLTPGAQTDFPQYLFHLPGFIYDCLPDGWGTLLLDRVFQKNNLKAPSPLERLVHSTENMPGALTFKPLKEGDEKIINDNINLIDIVNQNKEVFDKTEEKEALLSLINYGGSAHGARPKTLLYYNEKEGNVSNIAKPGSAPWIFKFQAKEDSFESVGLEQIYMECAAAAGLEVSQSKYIQLNDKQACFATKRFDVDKNGKKIHTHTLAGLLQADFKILGAIDYETYLKAVNYVTKSVAEVKKAFTQCVFNVVFCNKDDHSKNFSFMMAKNNVWTCAPSYDLTFMPGSNAEHNMAVNNKGKNINYSDLIGLIKPYGIDEKKAKFIIDKVCHAAIEFEKKYKKNNYNVSASTIKEVNEAIKYNVANIYKAEVAKPPTSKKQVSKE